MSDRLIIVDWGTSAFRAWLLDAESNEILEEISDGKGMRALAHGDFARYAAQQLGPWREGAIVPIYLAGMVGAPQGWQNAPQPPLPLRLEDLVADITAVDDMENAFIIPGVSQKGLPQDADVIRGEEVQVFGALSQVDRDSGLICLPGTHSKWCAVKEGVFERFDTVMTGEVFDVMTKYSILGLMADLSADFDDAAFEMGLEQSQTEGGLLNHLFKARSRRLNENISAAQTAGFLSGVLIGAEIECMKQRHNAQGWEVLLVCSARLVRPYSYALRYLGLTSQHVSSKDASIRGVLDLAKMHRAAQAA